MLQYKVTKSSLIIRSLLPFTSYHQPFTPTWKVVDSITSSNLLIQNPKEVCTTPHIIFKSASGWNVKSETTNVLFLLKRFQP